MFIWRNNRNKTIGKKNLTRISRAAMVSSREKIARI
jgi:hypothetical protein